MSTTFAEKPTTQRLAMALLCSVMLLPVALGESKGTDAGKRHALKLLSEASSQQLKRQVLSTAFERHK